jgi:hypothetical protein
VEYDGILVVIWEVRSLEHFKKAYRDPYYINVIEPDEHNLLDRNGEGHGVVAATAGKIFLALDDGRSTIGPEGEAERAVWKEWEERIADEQLSAKFMQ